MSALDGDVIITIRMLMVGKEIGGIIGKGGANVAGFREESGARITISTAQVSPERIVTITGGQSQIHTACQLITEKMNKDINAGLSSGATNKVPVTIRLIVPASQCGSIIGKGGVKIKEIRDSTGCSIQVQSEMLPNSSERTVTLSGAPTTIIHCIDMLIDVMIQYPAKTATVPYKPQGGNASIIFHHGQAYMLQGQYAVPNPDVGKLHKTSARQSLLGSRDLLIEDDEEPSSGESPPFAEEPRPTANFPVRLVNATTQEITVGNDVIGCIIGKGGSRINEIRSLSGAQIKISQGVKEDREGKDPEKEEQQPTAPQDRKIVITGSPEEISLASYLINVSVQLFSSPDPSPGGFHTPHRMGSSRVPDMFGGHTSLLGQPPGAFGGGFFGGVLAPGAFGAAMMSARRSLMSSSRYREGGSGYRGNRGRNSNIPSILDVDFTADIDLGGDSPNGKDKRRSKREKYQPY